MVKLSAGNQHTAGHGVSKYLLFSFFIMHFCRFQSAVHLCSDHVTIFSVSSAPFLWTGLLAPSLHHALPRCVLLLPPAPLGHVGLLLLEAAGQALIQNCRKTGLLQNPCRPRSLLFALFIAFVHRGMLLAPRTYQLSCKPAPKIWDIPRAAAPLPHKSPRKFSKHGFRLFLLLSSSSTVESTSAELQHPLFCLIFRASSLIHGTYSKPWEQDHSSLYFARIGMLNTS